MEIKTDSGSLGSDAGLERILRGVAQAAPRQPAEKARPTSAPPTIGPYRLVETLGRGGMGIVYRAEHLETGQPVALKTVRLPHAGLLQGIRREIHALARIRHPGIVRILDQGLHEGLPWYAMELLEGVTLRYWRTGSPRTAEAASPSCAPPHQPVRPAPEAGGWWTRTLSARHTGTAAPGEAARVPADLADVAAGSPILGARGDLGAVLTVVRRLCMPLAFLHGEGIVFCDLKPDNILIRAASREPEDTAARAPRSSRLTAPGWPVLVDFGLAARFGGELSRETLSIEAGSAGTLAYMAPEQIRGELPDARADLYALGCILYELLTGWRPFAAEDRRGLLELHLLAEPVAPSSLEPAVPPALDELVLRLLAKQPRDRLGHADDVAAALADLGAETAEEPDLPPPRAYLYRTGFSGREQPLAALQGQLDGLAKGRGGIVLVGGESGVGKTRLMVELGRGAVRREMTVLAGECLGMGGGPLEAFRKPLQALCDRCQEGGLAEAERVFGARGPVLRPYEPAIGHLPGQEAHGPPAELPPEDSRTRLLYCLSETLLAAATRSGGLLLLLDDLQWADDLALSFLEQAARTRSLESLPVLLLGTYRSEETGDALEGLLAEAAVRRVQLGRLDEQAVAAMLGDMLALVPPPVVFSHFLSQQSEGSPFFVAEYLRAAVAEGLLYRDRTGRWQVEAQNLAPLPGQTGRYEDLPLPRSLRDLVGRRLDGLAHPVRRLAEAAAVLGRESDMAVLRQMTGLEEAGLYSAAHELLRRQVMEEADSGHLRFAHDKIREVAYERLDASARPALHRAAAEAIEMVLVDGQHQEPLGELGRHWEAAGQPRKAAGYYLPAARAAAARFAHQEAVGLYRAYLRLVEGPSPESITARNELGEKLLELGERNEEALVEHEQALSEAQRLGARALEGESLRGLGQVHWSSGRMEESQQLHQQSLALFREVGDQRNEGNALGSLALLYQQQGRVEQARRFHEQALELHRQIGNQRDESRVLGNLASMHMEQGRLDEASQLHEQALIITLQGGNRLDESSVLGNLANLRLEQGRLDEARRLYEQALVLLRQLGHRRNEGFWLGNLAIVHMEQGRLDEACQLYEQALAIARQIGDRRCEGAVLSNLAIVHMEQGRLDTAQQLYEQALEVDRQIGARRSEGIALDNLAALHLQQGRLDEASQLHEQALDLFRQIGDRRYEGVVLAHLANLHMEQGRLDDARPLYEQALDLVRQASNQRSEGMVLGGLAHLALLGSADLPLAEKLAEEGERLLMAVGDRFELGRVLCCRGHIALAGGQGGREQLERAEALASTAGAVAGSPLGKAVSMLRRAVQAFEAGEHDRLFRGHLRADLPEALHRRLLGTSRL